MKTSDNSSTYYIEGFKRLYRSIFLFSLLLLISSAHLTGQQCSITLTSGEGSDNQTVCVNKAINNIVYSTTEATGASFEGLPSGVTGNWADNVVTIYGTPSVSGSFNFTVTATGVTCENITASGLITVNELLPVSVSIAAETNPVCAGATVNFTATPVNGGTAPSYQWYVDATPAGTGGSTFSYIPENGDVVSCVLTSDIICASDNPATSNAIEMTVNEMVPVSISIEALPAGSVCSGTSVTFTATPINEGTAPVYQWYLNGSPVGTNQPTYTSATLSDEDNIYCVLTSSETCVTGSPATSNTVAMDIIANLPVSVSIAALPAGSVCSGTSVTFTATPVNGGTAPSYQWYVDGSLSATGGNTYSYIPGNGDVVTCVLTSDIICASTNPATSNEIVMTVNELLPVSVSIAADANPVCAGTTVNFTATPVNGGTAPSYQWYVDGTPAGTGGNTYSYIPGNGDVVTCILTSDIICTSTNPATSEGIVLTVNALPAPPIVSSSNPTNVCPATTVNLTSLITSAIPTGGSVLYKTSNDPLGSDVIDPTAVIAGDYFIFYRSLEGCYSTGTHVIVSITDCPPDVTITLMVSPNIMHGLTYFNVIVQVTELNNINTNGLITVNIPKDSRWILTDGFVPSLTIIGTTPINNNMWTYSSDAINHIFTTVGLITAGSFSTFGFRVTFDPGSANGSTPVTSQLVSGSGGESKVSNNADSEKIDFFHQ